MGPPVGRLKFSIKRGKRLLLFELQNAWINFNSRLLLSGHDIFGLGDSDRIGLHLHCLHLHFGSVKWVLRWHLSVLTHHGHGWIHTHSLCGHGSFINILRLCKK